MRFIFRAGLAAITFLLLFTALFVGSRGFVAAAGFTPPGPDRFALITEQYAQFIWWLARWSDNSIVCRIEVDHSGLPSGDEIINACGEELFDKWIKTPPCDFSDIEPDSCTGYYLHFVRTESESKLITKALPPPVVWVSVNGCIPYNSSYQCDELPSLVLTGEEPLKDYTITSIGGVLNDKSFTCEPVCQVDLAPTNANGLLIKFWAYSSYGDSSQAFEARVRVRGSDDPNDLHWYVDVLTTQWRGAPPASCALGWKAFPPVGGLVNWLATPDYSSELASNVPYAYLAGNLITHDVVDASSCADGGLLENGYASACGTEVARSAVEDWQNRFDGMILKAAKDVGVPAQLLKNIFSRESQFWPGVTSQKPEAGLGQLTDNGADTALLWNRPLFEQFCPLVLDNSTCLQGYPQLDSDQRASLRTALLKQVDAFCADCPLGIDLDEAETSISVFAETLLANCAQTGMVIDLNYQNPNPPPSYEDLWRFTLTNYNAGPGCLGLAIDDTARSGEPLDWGHVSSHFTPVCSAALDYVNDVTSPVP